MKYKLRETSTNNYNSQTIKEDILKFRGIENPNQYLNLKKDVEIHYSKLKNIDKAIQCLIKHAENGSDMYIQVDTDTDGFTSAATLYKGIKKAFPNINIYWGIQKGKEHGVNLKQIPQGVKLVLIPDAGSNQLEEHNLLKEKGVDCIVLDHHDCDEESKCAIVVNNQLSDDYENKALSGVGIVFKFLQALDDELWLNNADEFADMVGVGLIADMMDITNLETRYYINKGLKNIKSKIIKQLIHKQEYSMKGKVNPVTIGFYVAPLINAMIRYGSIEEKELMFRAFIDDYEVFKYTPRKSKNNPEPIEIEENIYERVARLCGNAKSRQDNTKKKNLEEIESEIDENYLKNNKLIIIDISEKLKKTLTGLVANELAKKFMRPCILLRKKDDKTYGGSIRGLDNSEMSDFKSFLKSLEIFDFVEGHPNAAGFEIKASNIDKLFTLSNERLREFNFDKIYIVDYIVPFEDVSDDLIEEIYNMNGIWGQGLKETLVAIENIEVNTEDIVLKGDKKDTVSFEKDGLEFIKFKCKSNEYETMIGSDDGWGTDIDKVILNIVGKCSVNDYNNERKLQIVIEDFEVI